MKLHEATGIAYRSRNADGAEPPIIFVHGAAGNMLAWLASTRVLADTLPERPIYFLDLPGHGKSRVPGMISVDEYARALMDFIFGMGFRRCCLVGHSMGGGIVLTAALDAAPDLIEKVAVLGSSYRIPVIPALFTALKEDFAGAMEMMRQWGFGNDADLRIVDAVVADMMDCNPVTALNDFKACHAYDIKDRVGQLKPPLAVLYGSLDVMVSENRNKALAAAVPGAKLIRFEGASHMLMAERPKEAANELVEFFRG
jgi:3-oxoadipate enol-lactonase